jgi:hypothetical protein
MTIRAPVTRRYPTVLQGLEKIYATSSSVIADHQGSRQDP